MKYLLYSFLTVLSPYTLTASQIPIGFHSKQATIWRYWEINANNLPEAKMVVYNKTDKPITFCMVVMQPSGEMTAAGRKVLHDYVHRDNDTIVRPVTILPHQYGIYGREYAPANSSLGIFDVLFIDGARIGMTGIGNMLPITKFEHRYYSNEGLGGYGFCLVGKDNLFSERGQKDKMAIYINYPHPIPGINDIRLVPVINKGVQSLALHAENGMSCDADSTLAGLPVNGVNFNRGILVHVSNVDFKIAVEYTVADNDTEPEFDLRNFFANGNQGIDMPILTK